jgi:pimeloyl-ACP methyl ester carboxylesterase
MLERVQGTSPRGALAVATHSVREQRVSVAGRDARLYWPTDVSAAPAIVVAHGVHRLGMDEPRLVGFSRALAADGLIVMTPQLPALADYRVDDSDIATIGDSARALAQATGARQVGVLGLSFAGGLALLAAADPGWRDAIAYTIAVGAHDDLARVMRFFVTGDAPRPDGTIERLAPHEYGALVVAYSHVDDFFGAADSERARQAIRLYLGERSSEAKALAATLAPESRRKMQDIFDQRREWLAPALLAEIERHGDELRRVSPHGQLGGLRAPVLLLHGAGDNVIPAIETLWLEREVPPQQLRAALVSRAISHVELGGKPDVRDRLALVNWVAELLATAHAAPKGQRPNW